MHPCSSLYFPKAQADCPLRRIFLAATAETLLLILFQGRAKQ